MYALIDCNNFYCSCERLFNPALAKKPIIVLSNNDGCAIARSEEAKALGIIMGTPHHMIDELLKRHDVAVFSSNYTLYGDMSDRVMKTIGTFVAKMEIYSIDETFVDFGNLIDTDLHELGLRIRKTVMQNTGIPVTVGIAKTKTLSKMANRFAKKGFAKAGVFLAQNEKETNEMLAATPVENIWGIGHQHAQFLKKYGFHNALQLTKAPEEWIRVHLSVVGQRLHNELKGIPCIAWEESQPVKQNITTSRSFGTLLQDRSIIGEAIANHAATCAQKLRQQETCCKTVHVFISTNLHKPDHPQYMRSIDLSLDTPSNNTPEIIKYAIRGFDIIFKEGYNYLKCGVIVQDFVPETSVQSSMFDAGDRSKNKTIMQSLDSLNKSFGKDMIRFAVQGYERKFRLKSEWLSPKYTTRIEDIIKVKI